MALFHFSALVWYSASYTHIQQALSALLAWRVSASASLTRTEQTTLIQRLIVAFNYRQDLLLLCALHLLGFLINMFTVLLRLLRLWIKRSMFLLLAVCSSTDL